ncbi:MAG: DMT family transporter [Planctomycetaceae bacterium]
MTSVPAWAWLVGVMVIGLSSGFLLGTQPSVNGHLSRQLEHPLQASIVSFAIGTVILVILAVAMGVFPPRLQTPVSQMPWWIWGGGAIGALLVTASLILVPRIGSLPWHAAIIAGQMSAALVLDHYGWLGNLQQPLSRTRAIGAALLVAGVIIIFWAKKDVVATDTQTKRLAQPVESAK